MLASAIGLLPAFATGTCVGGALALTVLRAQRGRLAPATSTTADPGRMTAAALAPLAAEGWVIERNVSTAHGTLEHVVTTPDGVTYLLESKIVGGRLSLEDGVLLAREADGEPRRLGWVAPYVRSRAAWLDERGGRGSRGVRPVVVLWGDFRRRRAEFDGVVYVHGEALAAFLRGLPVRLAGAA